MATDLPAWHSNNDIVLKVKLTRLHNVMIVCLSVCYIDNPCGQSCITWSILSTMLILYLRLDKAYTKAIAYNYYCIHNTSLSTGQSVTTVYILLLALISHT